MIEFQHLTLRRGARILFQDADLRLHPGWRIGLTGRNGSGKSSLFGLLRGELAPDAGQCLRPAGWRIAHMAQEVPALAQAALAYVLDGDAELRHWQDMLGRAEAAHDGMAIGQAHQMLDAIDAWRAEARAGTILAGLGFQPADLARPVSSFSGGWRMRLNLARTLMSRAELLLLDEPTNHLDLDAILWLEGWLRQYDGTLLLIAHDREFLDATVSHILHIEQETLTLYSGDYSTFERTRAEKLGQQQSAFVRQQAEIAHMEDFVRRFRAKATKAKQAQSRIKALERMERILPAHVDSPFHFSFRAPEQLPDPLLRLDEIVAGYGDTAIVGPCTLQLAPDTRLALLGPNGAGKSTLLRTLVGRLTPLRGERLQAEACRIGYFDQHQVDALDPEASPLLSLARLAGPQLSEQTLRDYLGGFDFGGSVIEAPLGRFSGGEKARLALALIVWQRPNLLVLDEPTNHLDLEMREALIVALQDFAGAVVLVSHDRHLLRATVDDLLLVADGQARPFDGDLDDYARWLDQRHATATAVDDDGAVSEAPKVDKREERRQAAQKREQLRPLKQALSKLEQRMGRAQDRLAAIEGRLADPALYDEVRKEELRQLVAEQGQLQSELEPLELEWLELCEQIEAAEQD